MIKNTFKLFQEILANFLMKISEKIYSMIKIKICLSKILKMKNL